METQTAPPPAPPAPPTTPPVPPPRRRLGGIIATVLVTGVLVATTWLLWRMGTAPDKDLEAIEASLSTEGVDRVDYLLTPSEEMLRLGRRIYIAQCAACHGPNGRGDGNGATRLRVRPRDFRTQPLNEYRNGASPLAIYHTLNHGLGGLMPTFPYLDRTQKFAVAHYVRTFMPEAPTDPPERVEEFRARLAGLQAAREAAAEEGTP